MVLQSKTKSQLGDTLKKSNGNLNPVRYGILDTSARKEIFGLECQDQLEWRGWTPGTEYSKNYILKNVSTDTLRITYKQTASKSFSMDYSEVIKLRPGMSHPLKVTFRPLKMQQYSDHIEVFCNDSSFIVLVEAYTPSTHVECPGQLDFGFVPTKETVIKPLVVRNTGDVKVGLSWSLGPPFSISPATASIQPGSEASFDVSFTPTEASFYSVSALCKLDSGSLSNTVTINGIGKFPYLSLEQPSIDFGSVLVGKTVERTFRFGNHSPVDANFTVVHGSGDGESNDGVFSIQPSSGRLGPDEYSLMRVVYTPKHTGTFSSESFFVSTAGGNKVELSLRGGAVGPVVTLSSQSFNFGNVPTGQNPTRVLTMQNHSEVAVHYDWQMDAGDNFSFSKPRGLIAPISSSHVTVSFSSQAPAAYWKRASCIVKDAEPLSLDLLATCYDDKSRPPPFLPRHIDSYITRVAAGGPPVEVDPASVGSLAPSPIPGGPDAISSDPPLLGVTEKLQVSSCPLATGPSSWQLLFEGQDPASALTLDVNTLDFGSCARLSAPEHKSVTVTNHTSSKITAFFSIPKWTDPANPGALSSTPVFQVLPKSADLRPMGQTTFRVAFRPPKDGQYYAMSLQLRAFVKAMRNFRLVPDPLVVPPWSLPLLAVGNTFLHSNPEFAPKVEISHKSISFPPSRPHEAAYQTLSIFNRGDTPSSFRFHLGHSMAGLDASLFSIKPEEGLVPPKGTVLVALKFNPKQPGPATARATCTFNGIASTGVSIALSGTAHVLRLSFQDASSGNTLFFRPTCLGAASRRTLTLRNPSRVPVSFAWQIPPKLQGVVSVSPSSGRLRGNESIQVTWSFAPGKQKTYETRIPCLLFESASSIQGFAPGAILSSPDPTSSSFTLPLADGGGVEVDQSPTGPALPEGVNRIFLKVIGEGTQGALALDPPSFDLGTLTTGHAVTRTLTLVNQSDGVLRYKLECQPTDPGGGEDGEALGDGEVETGATPVEFKPSLSSISAPSHVGPTEELWVDEPEGIIAARASKPVTLTFLPRFRKGYRMELRCSTATVAAAAPPSLSPLVTGSPARAQLPPLSNRPSSAGLSIAPGASGTWVLGASWNGEPVDLSRTSQPTAEKSSAAIGSSSVAVVCPLIASTTFPTLMVTDLFLEGLPKNLAWDLLGVPEINLELQKQVTGLELDLEGMEDKGMLTTEVAQSSLVPFELDLGTHPLGAGPCRLSLELSNVTDLAVKWDLMSSDNPDLEMENWVEPGRPRDDQEKAIDFIVENGIFEFEPRGGLVETRGSKSIVHITYRPNHLGLHELPVFLRIKDGKRLHFKLKASTVSPPIQKLLLTPSHRVVTFDPTPVGESSPPLHSYLLRNGGPGEVRYRLDLTSLVKSATRDNWGFRVLQLRSPPEGVIPDLGVAALNWSFAPLEARVYSFEVPVILGDGSLEILTLIGRGFLPDQGPSPPPGSLMLAQTGSKEGGRDWALWQGYSPRPSLVPKVGRLATPCHDTLSFGTLLPGGLSRRVLVLTNTSEYPLSFHWDLGLLPARAPASAAPDGPVDSYQCGLEVFPASGRLEPGSRSVCRLTLEGGVVPQMMEAEIKCHVSVDEDTAFRLTAEAVRDEVVGGGGGVEDGLGCTETGSVIEEVIAQDFDKTGRRSLTTRITRPLGARPRVPVHLYMTASIRSRISNLDEQFTRTLEAISLREGAQNGTLPTLPSPQTLLVSVMGRILTPRQIEAGHYIPPHEVHDSKLLLQGAAWFPPPRPPPLHQTPQERSAEEAAPPADEQSFLPSEEKRPLSEEEESEAAGEGEGEKLPGSSGEGEAAPGHDGVKPEEDKEEAVGAVQHKSRLIQDASTLLFTPQRPPPGEVFDAEDEDDFEEGEGGGGGGGDGEVDGTTAHGGPESDQRILSRVESRGNSSSTVGEAHNAGADEMRSHVSSWNAPAPRTSNDFGRRSGGGSVYEWTADKSAVEAFAAAWRPLPAPSPVDPPPPPPPPSSDELAHQAAMDVLRGLVTSALVVGDKAEEMVGPVPAAWRSLEADRIPTFAQLTGREEGQPPLVTGGLDPKEELLKDGEFKAFAEFVLESVVLSLLSESAEGDWSRACAI